VRSNASQLCSRRAVCQVSRISDASLRTAGVVVKTAIAPAKYVLRQQHIADVQQLRAYSVGLMHCMCHLCWALHFMHCSKQREYHIGKLKSGDATVEQCCEYGKEVLHGTPLMLSASRSLGVFQFWTTFGLTAVRSG